MRELLKRIARNPVVAWLTDFLRIRGILRWVYRLLYAPEGGKRELSMAGRRAQFYIYTEGDAEFLRSGNGEFPMLKSFMAHLDSDDCFYDIGAGFGLYSVFLSKSIGEKGRIIAFEPQLDVYGRLLENLRLNEIHNVQAFRVALSDSAGEGAIQTHDGSAGRIVSEGGRSPLPREHIHIVQGDDFISRQALSLPKLVKIDVEGHEYAVIKGLTRTLAQPCCRLLFCEIHPSFLPQGINPEDVLALLRSAGFNEIETHPRGPELHAWAAKRSGA